MLSWLLLFRFPKLLLLTKSSRLWFQLTYTKTIMGQLQTKRQDVLVQFHQNQPVAHRYHSFDCDFSFCMNDLRNKYHLILTTSLKAKFELLQDLLCVGRQCVSLGTKFHTSFSPNHRLGQSVVESMRDCISTECWQKFQTFAFWRDILIF